MTAAASPISGFSRSITAQPSNSLIFANPKFTVLPGLRMANASPPPAALLNKTSSSSKPGRSVFTLPDDHHSQSASIRLRRASSSCHRNHRQVCALRLLSACLSYLRPLGPGNGFAPRPHLLDETRCRRRRSNDPQVGQPFRYLPRVHGLHDRVPFRRGLRQAHRSHTRANRAQFPADGLGEAPPPFF